jgi:hypothetical protein
VHCQLALYLASHSLEVDVWDGDSLMQVRPRCVFVRMSSTFITAIHLLTCRGMTFAQVGSLSIPLRGLLRQGRPCAEVRQDVPVMAAGPGGAATAAQPIGTLIVRLISIGREAKASTLTQAAFDAAAGPGSAAGSSKRGTKVRLRAAPFQPGSPVAHELAGQGSPFASSRHRTSLGGGGSPLAGSSSPGVQHGSPRHAACAGNDEAAGDAASSQRTPAKVAANVLSFEHRKVSRQNHLQRVLLHGQPVPSTSKPAAAARSGRPGAAAAADPVDSLAQQLLADVDAVRKRQKDAFVRYKTCSGCS